MKCPKCGYNSFEFLDNCKKCGTGLDSFKKSMGIVPLVFPQGSLDIMPQQAPVADAGREEAPVAFAASAAAVPSGEDSEDSFTWDLPTLSETAVEPESAFTGFDLDFIKDEPKPVEPESDFSFDEELPLESAVLPGEGAATEREEFSFYEETLNPEEHTFAAAGGDDSRKDQLDPFGETGVMGEILPEQLQDTNQETGFAAGIGEPLPEQIFEQELVLEDIQEEDEKETSSEKGITKDPLDFSDFEKEFESIFQTEDTPADEKR